jgi:hypothetical protein
MLYYIYPAKQFGWKSAHNISLKWKYLDSIYLDHPTHGDIIKQGNVYIIWECYYRL